MSASCSIHTDVPQNPFGLPHVHDNTEFDRLLNTFDRTEQADFAPSVIPQLTPEQQVFDAVTTNTLQDMSGLYMIDAPAGTGNFFLQNSPSQHICVLRVN